MREELKRPDTARALRSLKAFQRDTVDYVYHRMYEADPPVRRFLVADEVGLGKTLVAKGVIARVIDHLWDKVGRIDIVYICSNSGIARQNISRLNITGHTDHRLPDRITLLPRGVRSLRHRKLNFISFTPGTSFNLRSSMGVAEERALLFWLLPDTWKAHEHGAISVLTGTARRGGFKTRVDEFRRFYNIDDELAEAFQRALLAPQYGGEQLKLRFLELCERVGRRENVPDDQQPERAFIIGELRGLLARVCIDALEPDLIILDEFQRFKNLLNGDDFAAELAKALFTYQNSDGSEQSRVLPLSATPFKMYTLHEEATAGDNHLGDFLDTVRFLQPDDRKFANFAVDLADHSRALLRYQGANSEDLRRAKDALQESLRQVMVRTERLAVTPDRNGMLKEVPSEGVSLESQDLASYVALQRVAAAVDHGDTMEYWKSAPYALNFMDDDNYQLKGFFSRAAASADSSKVFAALGGSSRGLLSQAELESYQRVDPSNARLRSLLNDTVGKGAAELFWVPPASPYYRLQAPFATASKFTKRLVFSAWQVVPKVVASLLTFEVERRLFGVPEGGDPNANTLAARKRRRGRLRYTFSEGRLTGMPVLALVYPSMVLATLGDPLKAAAELCPPDGSGPELDDVLARVRARMAEALHSAQIPTNTTGPGDQKWYWAAPILLDLALHEAHTRAWFGQANLSRIWQGGAATELPVPPDVEPPEPDEVDRWSEHVDEARRLLKQFLRLDLGDPPEDLTEVLAWLAVGGLANNALRAIWRVSSGDAARQDLSVCNAAAQVGQALRSLFNQPEVTASIQRKEDDESYWRRVLEYSAHGCLSAVLDEYAHVVFDADSLEGKPVSEIAGGIAAKMASALTLQTATLRADIVTLDAASRSVKVEAPFGFRTSFAVRYGARGDEGAAADRNQRLQIAFNSPFWPFVLCTTSVGQEGLDFHPYCHAVVHWNLPSNPVDLEQREGRVHRYKGHAIRKNVAARHIAAALGAAGGGDPWAMMFREARAAAHEDDSGLVPYWVYCTENGAQIERHVPALPLSRDIARKYALRDALTVYRMAFGQSRQEDIVSFLSRNVSHADLAKLSADLLIDLSPPRSSQRAESGAYDGSDAPALDTEAVEAKPVQPLAMARADVSLDRMIALLDTFKMLAPQARTRRLSHNENGDAKERLRGLLDAFTLARNLLLPQYPVEGAPHQHVPVITPEALATLLDQFALLKPGTQAADIPLPRYRSLLGAYVDTRH